LDFGARLLGAGSRHLSRGAAGARARLRSDVDRRRRDPRHPLRQRGIAAATGLDRSAGGGERCLPRGRARARRLQPADAGRCFELHGPAWDRRGAGRELARVAQGLTREAVRIDRSRDRRTTHRARFDMPDGPMTAKRSTAGEGEQRFDLVETLSFIWRQWKFVLGITAVTVLVGTIFLLHETPFFTATCQVLLDRQREKPPGGDAIITEATLDVAMLEGQMAVLQSTVFLRRVVEKEHLASATAANAPPRGSSYIDSVLSLFHLLGDGSVAAEADSHEPPAANFGPDAIPDNEMRAIQTLKGELKVSRVAQQGYVLGIAVTTPDPVRSARLANAIADAYLVDKLDTRYEAAKRASAWLSDRLTKLREQVQDSEEAVANFRAEHGLVQSGGVTLNQQQLSDLNVKLIDAKADLAQKKSRVDLLAAIEAKGGSLQNVPDIANGGALPALRQQLSNLSTQEADLLARYNASYPLVVNIRAQKRDIERSIAAETQRLAASLRNEY